MDAFIGEVRLFPYTFIPEGWELCNGQLLLMTQHPALYALVGTNYGGDGKTTFGVPNMNGRVMVAVGNDPTDNFDPSYASKGGNDQVTLTLATLPSHTHSLVGAQLAAADRSTAPAGNYLTNIAQHIAGSTPPYKTSLPYATSPDASKKVQLNAGTLSGYAGTAGPHENRQPVLGLMWCICLENGGVWPIKPV
jgi:microcystin-dependent protein